MFIGNMSDRVLLYASDHVIIASTHPGDDLPSGVVGVANEIARLSYIDDTQQGKHLIEERLLVAVRPHDAFVNAYGERYGYCASRGVHEQADRLQGMAIDKLGLVFGLLVQKLDRWHLFAALGDLDAVADQNRPAVDP